MIDKTVLHYRIIEELGRGGQFREPSKAVSSVCYPYMMSDPLLAPLREDQDIKQILDEAKAKYQGFRNTFLKKNEPEGNLK